MIITMIINQILKLTILTTLQPHLNLISTSFQPH